MSKLPNPYEAALVTVESAAEASGWACAVLTKPPESILLGFMKNSPFPYFAFDTHSQAGRVPACFFSIVNLKRGHAYYLLQTYKQCILILAADLRFK